MSATSCSAWNRLVRVVDGNSEQTIAEYEYDARNFRTLKRTWDEAQGSSSSGQPVERVRHYYYSPDWQVLEERLDDSTSADRQFIWGLRYIDDLVLRDRNADGNPETGHLGQPGSGLEERLYALQDANWNVVALAQPSGAIQERYTYTPYGQPQYHDSAFTPRATSSYDWLHLYCAYPWDAPTHSYHLRNRHLLPHLGRWNRRDPIGLDGGDSNLYGYVTRMPLAAPGQLRKQAKTSGGDDKKVNSPCGN